MLLNRAKTGNMDGRAVTERIESAERAFPGRDYVRQEAINSLLPISIALAMPTSARGPNDVTPDNMETFKTLTGRDLYTRRIQWSGNGDLESRGSELSRVQVSQGHNTINVDGMTCMYL
jgi:hypothetical protein